MRRTLLHWVIPALILCGPFLWVIWAIAADGHEFRRLERHPDEYSAPHPEPSPTATVYEEGCVCTCNDGAAYTPHVGVTEE